MPTDIYELSATSNQNEIVSFERYRGKVLLIVNTASKCGFTPQYAGLQEIYRKYHERGFEVLAFPCDQFGHQEPGSDEEIASFCSTNYGVSFQLMKKIDVNGSATHPVYAYLKNEAGGLIVDDIKWNFTKFLVSADGRTIKRYAPTTTPSALKSDIDKFLTATGQ